MPVLSGLHFFVSVEEDTQTCLIFSVTGIKRGNNIRCNVPITTIQATIPQSKIYPTGYFWIPNDSMEPYIRAQFDRLEQAGTIDQLAQIQVSAYGAMWLYFDNVLVDSDFANAVEGKRTVDFRGISVYGRVVDVQVLQATDLVHDVIAVDKDGNILPVD